jgi:hypothetical protein
LRIANRHWCWIRILYRVTCIHLVCKTYPWSDASTIRQKLHLSYFEWVDDTGRGKDQYSDRAWQVSLHCTVWSGLKLVFRIERQDCSHSSVDPDSDLLGRCAISSDPKDVGKGKGKFHLRTDNEGTAGEWMYRCALSWTSALGVGGWSTQAPAALPPVRNQLPVL